MAGSVQKASSVGLQSVHVKQRIDRGNIAGFDVVTRVQFAEALSIVLRFQIWQPSWHLQKPANLSHF